MAFADLRNLHRLHVLDAAIVEIRKRAAALDTGKSIQAAIAVLDTDMETVGAKAKALHAEQTDLEMQQKGIDAKIAQIDKDLYSGKVVNPREVEAHQKEIANLKKRRSDLDTRLLELMDELPPAKAAADEIKKKIDAKKVEMNEAHKKALHVKADLEAQYKDVTAKRGPAAALVPASVVVRYDAVRQKTGGVGMAEVVRGGFCAMCGTHLPVKLIEGAKEGRIVTCESCHRILYASDGLI